MEDNEILRLFNARADDALTAVRTRYGSYCRTIASRIRGNEADAEEVENDVLLKAWNTIPPAAPASLKSYLAMLTRQLAVDRVRFAGRSIRGGSEYALSLDELEESLPDGRSDDPADALALTEALNRFLRDLPEKKRNIFLKRYWYALSVREIAHRTGTTEANVKVRIFRAKERLRPLLKDLM